jgi:hypothetical protein
MNAYVPKVGDKVRATLGESVIVGEVLSDRFRSNHNLVEIDTGVESYAVCDRSDGWQFEQVVSVPTKFGAVIRRADGTLFTLGDPGQSDGWFAGGVIRWAEQDEATAGGFTVLFDGVDE